MPTKRVLADFAGTWDVQRQIIPDQGQHGQFSGNAMWTAQGDALAYAETGTLTLDGARPMHAERCYLWTPELDIFFDDGRFFHRVPAQGGEAEHWCDPDTYRVHYDFGAWPVFRTRWRVDGPRKGYVMTTTYCRAKEAPLHL